MFKRFLPIIVLVFAFALLFTGIGNKAKAEEGAGFASDPLVSKSYLLEKVTLEFAPLENTLNLIQTNVNEIEQKLKSKS